MRPTIDQTMLDVAVVLARRGTCVKMQVACVLTDYQDNIISTGYNGVARGRPHCNAEQVDEEDAGNLGMMLKKHPYACGGALSPPGANLCEAVHCEQNALTRCTRPDDIWTCYVTVSPCMRCAKQLLNTDCMRIVFLEEYTREPQARALWERAKRSWIKHETRRQPCHATIPGNGFTEVSFCRLEKGHAGPHGL